MNILITGCNGQLGNEMRERAALHTDHCFFFTDILVSNDAAAPFYHLDITNKQAALDFVNQHQIDLIVNCAAYTNVDKAEDDEPTAQLLNVLAVDNLGHTGCKIIHISTDYVFSGDDCLPYRPTDPTNPQTAYGRTKLEGEQRLLSICPEAIIIRTAWLYSSYGNNFVKTMIRLGQEHNSVGVVFDQVGSPTYAADLAFAILAIIENDEWKAGIYHYTNEGVCTWYDFAVQIHKLYNSQQLLLAFQSGDTQAQTIAPITCQVTPIRSEQYQYRTPRPHYSVLDKTDIRNAYNLDIPYWTESLAQCIQRLANDNVKSE